MNAKFLTFSYVFCWLLLSDTCFADSVALSSAEKLSEANANGKKLSEPMPKITNEAEYMEFIKKRDGANPIDAVKSKASSSASSRRAEQITK